MLASSTSVLQAVLALFCALLALLIALNLHVRFIHAIGRSLYSTFAAAIGFLTLGKVKLSPLAYRAKARQRRRLRELRMQVEDWRWRRSKQADNTALTGGWAVVGDETDEDDEIIPAAELALPAPPPGAGAIKMVEKTKPAIKDTTSQVVPDKTEERAKKQIDKEPEPAFDNKGFVGGINKGSKMDLPPSFD